MRTKIPNKDYHDNRKGFNLNLNHSIKEMQE